MGLCCLALFLAGGNAVQAQESYKIKLTGSLYNQADIYSDGTSIYFAAERRRVSTVDLIELTGSAMGMEFPPKSTLELDETGAVLVKYRGEVLADVSEFFTFQFAAVNDETIVYGNINLTTGLNRSRFVYPMSVHWVDPGGALDFTMRGVGFESYTKSPSRDGSFKLRKKARSKMLMEGTYNGIYLVGEVVLSLSGGGVIVPEP